MSEPIYIFVRGKGWVLETRHMVTMQCGTRVYLEHRMPNSGEPWVKATSWMLDDRPNYLEFKSCLQDNYNSYSQLCRLRQGYYPSNDVGVITVVKVD